MSFGLKVWDIASDVEKMRVTNQTCRVRNDTSSNPHFIRKNTILLAVATDEGPGWSLTSAGALMIWRRKGEHAAVNPTCATWLHSAFIEDEMRPTRWVVAGL
jgi:hypothetical protein